MSEAYFSGKSVALEDMLEARDRRSWRQETLLRREPSASLLSVTMNIPGPVKTSAALHRVFQTMTAAVRAQLQADSIRFEQLIPADTGDEYYLLTDLPAAELKRQMIALEQAEPLGRLFDLDVLILTKKGVRPLSRQDFDLPPRQCYVCSDSAKACGRSRRHSLSDMQAAIAALLDQTLMKKENRYDENPDNGNGFA